MIEMNLGERPQVTHDEMVATVLEVRELVSQESVVSAFLYSLSTRHLEYRSALGSFALARQLPEHEYSPHPTLFSAPCNVCGFPAQARIDWQPWEEQRHDFGGGYDDLSFVAFDLYRFSQLEPVSHSAADLDILREILAAARAVPAESPTAELEKALRKRFKSNKGQRQTLMSILAYCNIFQPEDCPGYLHDYPHYASRGDGSTGRADWGYPLSFWRGHDPINEAVQFWFPMLDD